MIKQTTCCDFLLVNDTQQKAYFIELKGGNICLLYTSLAVACLWMQLIPSMRLIYTDGIREQEDRSVMNEVSCRIHQVCGTTKPVAFVGEGKNNLNQACLRGEMIGKSIFNIDAGANPHYFFSTVRICENAKVMGFDMQHASEEQVKMARKEAIDMPVWPEEGSRCV